MSEGLRSRGPELLVDLADHTAAVLVERAGLPPEKALEVARAVADQMRRLWGGQQVYFPKGLAVDVSERDLELYRKFNGFNHEDLAREFGISVQYVYQRIKAVRAAEIARTQPSLFPE